MRVPEQAFIFAPLVRIVGLATNPMPEAPSQMFTVFRGLRSPQLDLDSIHPVECIRLEAEFSLRPR
jgi:hypothetical protein